MPTQRREDLLDAAVQLILSGGVEAVSMETVADRAGVSRPLVYKHSVSKNELLTGVYRRDDPDGERWGRRRLARRCPLLGAGEALVG